jgi:hypothetical protein
MILELHRERLEEELAERRKALGELEAWLSRSLLTDSRIDFVPATPTRRSPVAVFR